jgi:amino acid transporter
MTFTYLLAIVLVAVIIAVAKLRWRDRQLKRKGMAEEQILSVSHLSVRTSRNAMAMFIGIMLFFGVAEQYIDNNWETTMKAVIMFVLGLIFVGLGVFNHAHIAKDKERLRLEALADRIGRDVREGK